MFVEEEREAVLPVAVSVFVGDEVVTDEEGWFHGAGRDVERLKDKHADDKRECERDEHRFGEFNGFLSGVERDFIFGGFLRFFSHSIVIKGNLGVLLEGIFMNHR